MRAPRSTGGCTNGGTGATRIFALVIVACVSWQCAPNQDQVFDVRIVTTIYPLKMIVSEITGRTEAVACLLPPGATPHTFEPLASDLARIQDARLFVRVGGGLDSWAVRMLAALDERPTTLTLVDIEGLRLIHRDAADRHAHEGDDQHFDVDPHIWLDPLRVRDEIVPAVTEALARMDPEQAKDYRLRAARFQTLLSQLDSDLRTTLAPVAGQAFLAFHDTWRYFADRYGLQQQASVHEFAGEEPTPREVAEIITALRRSNTRAVIVEPQFGTRLAEVLSEAIGGKVTVADPLGTPADPERDKYDGLMRYNATQFVDALGAQ